MALAAIFVDASLGHGLTWENDPYWTYWVTKTFLIATVFGLGTAWLGIGVDRGAVITVVHTLILTVYYWTLSPVGLPSVPTWLDLEHTWVTGVPIHFAVVYAGYLLGLWAWQRRRELADTPAVDAGAVALRALVVGFAVLIVAGGAASLALGEFPGVTWFVVRLLITVSFLLAWWGLFGTDTMSAIVGAVVLSLMWATYSQFLGPVGLPDTPLRIFDPAPPPATVRWLDYKELWLISFPIYLVVMLAAMWLASRGRAGAENRRPLIAAGLIPVVLVTAGFTIDPDDRGVSASFTATGDVGVEGIGSASGDIRIDATDMGNRVTPLPPHDRLLVDATLDAGGRTYTLAVRNPLVEDPLGEETTWWGVAFGVDYREPDGESLTADLVAFGLGEVSVDGQVVARGVPVEVVGSRDEGYGLELEIGNEAMPLPGDTETISATWAVLRGSPPKGPEIARYIGGAVALLVVLALGLLLVRRSA